MHFPNFPDFIHSMPQTSVAELDVVTSVKEKATTAYDLDGANKADPDDGVPQPAGPSFWSFEFYKQLFDVNTQQITDRIVNSMVPRSGQNYLEAFIKPKADLYGLRILNGKHSSVFEPNVFSRSLLDMCHPGVHNSRQQKHGLLPAVHGRQKLPLEIPISHWLVSF